MFRVSLWFLSTSLLLLRSVTSQTYLVSDSFCPPTPAPSTSYIVNVTVSPTRKAVACVLQLRPTKTGDNWYAEVAVIEQFCGSAMNRPIIIRDRDDEFIDYFCGQQTSPVLKTFQLKSDGFLDISFATANYKSSVRLIIRVLFFPQSFRCSSNAILCSSTEPKCVALNKVCDGNQDCANGIDEPASCRLSLNEDTTTFNSNFSTSESLIIGWITNPFNILIIIGGVFFLFVLPSFVFCCCSKKKRKVNQRSRRVSGQRQRQRELVPDGVAAQRNASRSARSGENVGSGAAQRAASARYDALSTGPTAPPQPVGSVLAGPATPQMVLVPASQLVQSSLGSQPVYAVPFTQSGGQPTFFSQPLASGDRPQYVAAYVIQPGSIGAQTVANGQGNLPVSLGATDSLTTQCPSNASAAAAAAAGGSSNQIDACPPPSYDEAVRCEQPAVVGGQKSD